MANQLFQDYYTVYTPDTSNRGADTLSQKEKELISAFNEIGLKKSESIKVLKDYSEAVKSDYELSLYDADIHWYLALAYIKDNHLKDAIRECEYIIEKYPDSSYVSSAHALIEKIKSIPFI
jgi:outer membrane protein assembly factor BamD (BamD/ComL family)